MAKEQRDNELNIIKVLNYFPQHYDFRRNIITNDVEYSIKDKNLFIPVEENTLFIEISKASKKVSMSDIVIFLGSKEIPEYDPFKTYFKKIALKWDEKKHGDYISKFSSYVSAKNQIRFDLQFKKWLVRTVVCALVPEYFNKQAFILVQEKQNSGKTSFTRFMVPKELEKYCIENIALDKDSLIALCQNLIGILDELATLSKFEINSLKSTISKASVNIRHPYDRRAKLTPRRISFIGSTNRSEFLSDETGNVRWLCFEIDNINWKYKEDIDIDILWSQAYSLYLNGFKYEMTAEEVADNERANEQFQMVSTEMELIQKYYSPGTKDQDDQFYTPTEFLLYLTDKVEGKLKLNAISLGKALKILGYEKQQKKAHEGKSYPVRGYYIKYNDMATYYNLNK